MDLNDNNLEESTDNMQYTNDHVFRGLMKES